MTNNPEEQKVGKILYKLIVRVHNSDGTFQNRMPYVGTSMERLIHFSDQYMSDPTVDVTVEGDSHLVAVKRYGRLFWLNRIPPPPYWKPPTVAGTASRISACGLPIPERFREPILKA